MDFASRPSSAQQRIGSPGRAESDNNRTESSRFIMMRGMEEEELMIQYPSAAQPEMMRAAEKDEYYVSQLCEACYDAFRSTFGTRLAVGFQSELKLLGRVLYYLLTTGSGLQTLGEEYCDIVQVAGPSGLPATPARRTTLVFYQTVLPYLAERLSARAAARGNSLAADDDITEEENRLETESDGSIEEATFTNRTEERSSTSGSTNSGRPPFRERLRRAGTEALRYWPVMLPSVREAMLLIMRAHLMIYYFQGLYFHVGKRATSIRYIYMGKPAMQKPPRYHILGVFLLAQLTFVCGEWLARALVPAVASSVRSRVASESFSPAGARGIAILDEAGTHVTDKTTARPSSSWTDSEGSASSKCPLCLSPRQHPTATPCGHVFCWNCVAEWCNEKPECPLCRSPVAHPQLVCVYHADF